MRETGPPCRTGAGCEFEVRVQSNRSCGTSPLGEDLKRTKKYDKKGIKMKNLVCSPETSVIYS